MKTPFVFGLGMALANAVFALVLHLLGITTEPGRIWLTMLLGFPLALAILITGIVLATRQARATAGATAGATGFPYGRAFTVGFLAVLVAAVGGALFNAIYYKFIFPEFAEVAAESTRSMLEKFGARATDIEKAVEDIRTKSTIARQVVSGFAGTLIMGTIITLIVAAIMKRPPADDFDAPPRV